LTKLCATLERVSVQRQRPSSTSWHAQLYPHCHVSSVSGSVNPLSRWDSWGHSSEDLELPYPSGFYGARHGDQQQDAAHPGAAILEHHGGQHWCWSWTSPSQLQWQKGNVWLRTESGTMQTVKSFKSLEPGDTSRERVELLLSKLRVDWFIATMERVLHEGDSKRWQQITEPRHSNVPCWLVKRWRRQEMQCSLKRTWHHLCHFEWFWWSNDNTTLGLIWLLRWPFSGF